MTGFVTHEEFRALLDWFMCSDPWPDTTNAAENHLVITQWADEEARRHGFTDWIQAYHEL